MGVEALTTNLQGEQVIPVTADAWDDWVSASATRNHVLESTSHPYLLFGCQAPR
jgi:hypothetical protein